jgi:carbon-monoxide dehydrogenase large subunit
MISGTTIGYPVQRQEDVPLITGSARYVADLPVDGCLSAVFVRSPVAHGRVTGIGTGEARSAPGVVDVCVGGDLGLPPIPETVFPPLSPREQFSWPPLATDTVRFAGEALAVVVAESLPAAVDAAELVVASIDPLDAVVDPVDAMADGAPLLFPAHGSNLVIDMPADGQDALEGAEVVVRGWFRNQRVAPVPLETNAILALPAGEGLEVFASTQVPFRLREGLCAALGMDPSTVRVVAPAVGGGFGAKGGVYPEYLVVAALARRLNRPVRWVQERSENLMAMTHGRGQVQEVELGARRDGTLIGLRARTISEAGAYPWRAGIPARTTRLMAGGVYRVPRVQVHTQAVVTNTTPTGPYRGAGRPEAAAMMERAMDMLAAELDLDPAELRRRNFIRAGEFPYRTASGAVYDTGDYEHALDEALHLAGYEALRREQAERRARRDPIALGIGLSTFVEVSGGGWEHGTVRVNSDGSVTVTTGSSPHGQGHETTFAQIASSALGVPCEAVRVLHSDTAVVARGVGTFGSRSGQLGGSAVLNAAKEVVSLARLLAAHLLEASPQDIDLTEGGLAVRGDPSTRLSWAELSAAAADPARRPPGFPGDLAAEADVTAVDGGTYPFGAHVAVVDVDTETGRVTLRRFVAVDDCGAVINPMIVEGQVHGGLAQGVAQALFEEVRYDADGNPVTVNLADYAMPSAADLPSWLTGQTVTPTDRNALGVKGVGESGTVGSAVAVQNAVVDALRPWGVTHLDMPATPHRVWEVLCRAAQA